jgi:hypothetical protein
MNGMKPKSNLNPGKPQTNSSGPSFQGLTLGVDIENLVVLAYCFEPFVR